VAIRLGLVREVVVMAIETVRRQQDALGPHGLAW